MAKYKPIQGCSLCGSSLSLQSGLLRCSNPKCGHLHHQGTAFEVSRTYVPQSKFPEYSPVVPKDVDKEFQ